MKTRQTTGRACVQKYNTFGVKVLSSSTRKRNFEQIKSTNLNN